MWILFIAFGALLAFTPIEAGIKAECQRQCELSDKPVCGKNNLDNYLPFINQCFYEIHKCVKASEQWELAPIEKCPKRLPRDVPSKALRKECVHQCQADIAMCVQNKFGSRRKIYGPCQYEVLTCLYPDHDWKVTKTQCNIEKCDFVCSDDHYATCGENIHGDREVFRNPCFFDKHQCLNKKENWKEVLLKLCKGKL